MEGFAKKRISITVSKHGCTEFTGELGQSQETRHSGNKNAVAHRMKGSLLGITLVAFTAFDLSHLPSDSMRRRQLARTRYELERFRQTFERTPDQTLLQSQNSETLASTRRSFVRHQTERVRDRERQRGGMITRKLTSKSRFPCQPRTFLLCGRYYGSSVLCQGLLKLSVCCWVCG